MIKEIIISGNIKLDQFLKWAGITATGGQSKVILQSGKVKVNDSTETRRGCKLSHDDIVEVEGVGKFKVIFKQQL